MTELEVRSSTFQQLAWRVRSQQTKNLRQWEQTRLLYTVIHNTSQRARKALEIYDVMELPWDPTPQERYQAKLPSPEKLKKIQKALEHFKKEGNDREQ